MHIKRSIEPGYIGWFPIRKHVHVQKFTTGRGLFLDSRSQIENSSKPLHFACEHREFIIGSVGKRNIKSAAVRLDLDVLNFTVTPKATWTLAGAWIPIYARHLRSSGKQKKCDWIDALSST